MPKLVHVPGAGNVEFPDDFSEDQIKDALRKHFGTAAEEEKPPEPKKFDLSKIKLSPYEQAEYQYAESGRGRPETGLEAGTEFTTALGEAVQHPSEIPGELAGTPGRLAQLALSKLSPVQQSQVQTLAGAAGIALGDYLKPKAFTAQLPGGTTAEFSGLSPFPSLQAPPEAGVGEKMATGGLNVLGGIGSFLMSPEGIGLQAAPTALSRMTGIAPKLAQKAVGYTAAAAFAPSLTAAAAQQWGQFAGSPDAQLGTEAAGTTALVLLTAGGGVVLPRTLKEVARSIYAQRLRDNAKQVPPPRLEPEIREGEGRPDLEQPAPRQPSGTAPRTEAAAPTEGQSGVLLKEGDSIPNVQRDEEGFADSDNQPHIQEKLDQLPVGTLVQHHFTGDVFQKRKGGEWSHRPDLQIPGNGTKDAGTASAGNLARAKILKLGERIESEGKLKTTHTEGQARLLLEEAKAKSSEGEPSPSTDKEQYISGLPNQPFPELSLEQKLKQEAQARRLIEERYRFASPEVQREHGIDPRTGLIPVKSEAAAPKPAPTEPARPRTLTPAVRSDVDPTKQTTGPDHGSAKIRMKVEHDEWPSKGQNEGFKDENGNWLTRSQGADRFYEMTGRRPAIPDSLRSEDLKNANLLGHLEAPAKAASPATAPKVAEAAKPAEAKPEVAVLGTSERTNRFGDPATTKYHATPEDWAEWQRLSKLPMTDKAVFAAREVIKNKYGGMPPQPPKTATQPVTPPAAEPPKPALTDAELWAKANRKEKLTPEESRRLEIIESAGDEEGGGEVSALQAEADAAKSSAIAEPPKPAEAVTEPPKTGKPSTAVEAPKAEVSIATEEPPHGVKLDVTTPAAHPLGPIATTTTPTLAWHQILTGELKEAGAGLRRFWRSFSMQSLPRITEADRRTGELGVRYDASRTVARVKGLEFAENVLAGIKAKGFDQQFGTALAEDNLRGIRRDFQDSAQKYRAEGKTEEADAALESASKVTTLIGARNSPFASEAQYQAFLNAPEVQQAIRRHIQLWQEQKDPIYRKANDIDPDVVLETRGLQTGARINLKAVMPEAGTRTTVGAAGRSPLIRQAVTRLRKDPFARQAKGTGTSYEGSYREIMANGYEREFPVAAQHEFIKQMIDSGLAKVTVNREFPKGMLIRGETPKAFELKIGPWRNQWLQVPRSMAEEFQNVSGLTPGWNVPVVKPLSDLLTQASVQGFAEGSTHVSNLSTGILTNLGPTANPLLNALIKSAGRVDVLYTLPRILIRGFTATREEMLNLAEMGAAKTPYGGLMGWFINGIDRGVRLVSADVYDGMARKGWVKDTETGKREFINQVGQYSKRLQPTTIARLRETGVQPFATAMHTFNVQGLRTLGLGPGAKAPTALAALALRADKAAGIMGFIVLVTAINKLISGKAAGPPGTQLGSVGWMGDDGKLRQFNLARAFGYERGFRTTGLQGFVEARRLGLPEATALGAGVRSVGQTGLGYVSGPATQFATKAITGKHPGIPMVQEAKVVPPPATDELQPLKTQAAANIAIALQQANPAVDAALMAMQGKEVPDILQRQFSRYTPRAGMSQETIEAMPKIMAAKQMGDYVTALAKEARKLPLAERNKFVRDRLWEDELTAQQRAQALQRLQVKGVFRYR